MAPTILTVDDDETHRYVLVQVLKSAGFNVISAPTGTQALALAIQHKPHAVLLDVNLPDVDGFEVCLRIKSHPEMSGIPIIFHTDSPAGAVREHAESVGCAAFLTYPIDAEHLVTVVRGSLVKNGHNL